MEPLVGCAFPLDGHSLSRAFLWTPQLEWLTQPQFQETECPSTLPISRYWQMHRYVLLLFLISTVLPLGKLDTLPSCRNRSTFHCRNREVWRCLLPSNAVACPQWLFTVRAFIAGSASIPWFSPTDFSQIIIGVTSIGAPIRKVQVTPVRKKPSCATSRWVCACLFSFQLSGNRVQCSFTAGGITLQYTVLTTVWIDDIPIASNFHLYQPDDILPSAVTDFLNLTSMSPNQWPNPVSWATFVVPTSLHSILIDPAYSMLLDPSTVTHQTWIYTHRWIALIICLGKMANEVAELWCLLLSTGAVVLIIASVITLVLFRRKQMFRGLWQTTYEPPKKDPFLLKV